MNEGIYYEDWKWRDECNSWLLPGLLQPTWWRWGVANWCRCHGRPLPAGFADEWLHRADRFLAAGATAEADPEVHQARNLFKDPHPFIRPLLEAYLLTGELIQVAADRTGVPQPIVELYAKLFFDVVGRLKGRDWVACQAIGLVPGCGAAKSEVGRLWRAFGFYSGRLCLDAIVFTSVTDGLAVPPPGFDRQRLPTFNGDVVRSARLAIAVHLLPADIPLKQYAELMASVRRLERRRKVKAQARLMDDVVQQLLVAAAGKPLRTGRGTASPPAAAV